MLSCTLGFLAVPLLFTGFMLALVALVPFCAVLWALRFARVLRAACRHNDYAKRVADENLAAGADGRQALGDDGDGDASPAAAATVDAATAAHGSGSAAVGPHDDGSGRARPPLLFNQSTLSRCFAKRRAGAAGDDGALLDRENSKRRRARVSAVRRFVKTYNHDEH